MTMRTESEIREDMAACKQAYSNKPTYELAMKGKSLNAELIECLREGANNCPTCGDPPHAMLKRAEMYGRRARLARSTRSVPAGHEATKEGKAHARKGRVRRRRWTTGTPASGSGCCPAQ
jgi:hypothetical protein